ncbi:lipase family protein [Microbacterium sp. ARD32]|uniref:lipase family protein n=1 Tax=Microbacterium sp. ARD32 TaxID=2962577 RepID=UPI00288BF6F1|nr:lipase family protein [Microbacterium sp. ARD32]
MTPATPSPATERPWLRLVRRLPKPVTAVLATAAVLVGAVLIVHPTTALDVLALLIGAGLVLAGLLELMLPVILRAAVRVPVGALLIITGGVVLLLPDLTVRGLAVIAGVALIVRGAISVAVSIRPVGTAGIHTAPRPLDRRIAEALLGVAGVAFGILGLVWPDVTLLVVGAVFGSALAFAGVAALWRMLRGRRSPEHDADRKTRRDTIARRWMRTIGAVCVVALAAGAVIVSVALRGGAPVVDDFYVAPRSVPGEAGELIRAEPFTRGVPEDARAWRILYTTTHGDGSAAVASGLVVVPRAGERHPVIAWHHGTTGFDRRCAPSLAADPFGSGALFVLDGIIEHGWALVATDYIGLGTQGPHPYLVGADSARAELDAVRAARGLENARLSQQTVAWGHSQGGGAALWSEAIADDYAPDVPLAGAVALAPVSDVNDFVDGLGRSRGGSIFASFVVSAYSEIYPRRSGERPAGEPADAEHPARSVGRGAGARRAGHGRRAGRLRHADRVRAEAVRRGQCGGLPGVPGRGSSGSRPAELARDRRRVRVDRGQAGGHGAAQRLRRGIEHRSMTA